MGTEEQKTKDQPKPKPRARNAGEIITDAEADLAKPTTALMVLKWDAEAAFYEGQRVETEHRTDKVKTEWRDKIMKLSMPSQYRNQADEAEFDQLMPSPDYTNHTINIAGDATYLAQLTNRIANLMRSRFQYGLQWKLKQANPQVSNSRPTGGPRR